MNSLSISLDLSNVEHADDGDITHFGGFYVVDGVQHRAYGDDRSDNWMWDLIEAIVAMAQEKLGVELDTSDVLDIVEGLEVGTILIGSDGSLNVEE